MRTGRLSISRGHELAEPSAPPHLSVVPAPPAESPPPRYDEVGERLTALERLVRLAEQGALSAEEFAAEKALILGRPGGPAPLSVSPVPGRRPSLLGRLVGWKLMPLGLAAGVAFSFAAQPVETTNFFTDLRGLAGF